MLGGYLRLIFVGVAASCFSVVGAFAAAHDARRQSFDLTVPVAPVPVLKSDGSHLVYEMHITNFAREPLRISRVAAYSGSSGTLFGELTAEDLIRKIECVGGGASGTSIIAPGARAIVYLDWTTEATKVPSILHHDIEFSAIGGSPPATSNVEGPTVQIDDGRLPVLGPPLGGGPWIAVYNPSMERGHRRVVYAVGGRARIPGRFAIDWMKPATDPSSAEASGYGAEVLAVSDAVVEAARDGIADHWPQNPSTPGSLEDAAGNYISLALGNDRFAIYEHLAPGLLVRPGDKVQKGQVIAKVGATGQASKPHLHFHVGDSPAPLAAEGLPYLLEEITLLGRYRSFEDLVTGGEWQRESSQLRQSSFPDPNVLIRFPRAQAAR